MLRILIPLMAGISSAYYWDVPVVHSFYAYCIFILLMFPGAFRFRWLYNFNTRFIPGLLINTSIYCLGYVSGGLSFNTESPHHYHQNIEAAQAAIIEICSEPVLKGNRLTATASVIALISNNQPMDCRGLIRLVITGESLNDLHYRQKFIVPSDFKDISDRYSPGGFDYRAWLAMRGIQQQLYLNADQCIQWQESPAMDLRSWSRNQQQTIVELLGDMLSDSSLAGVAAAMLLGDKSGLDFRTAESFREAGIVHVLCVSGLHTGTVYAAALAITSLMSRGQRRKKWIELIPLLIVWMYAFLTGLAASVTRAALMLSLYAVSRILRRKTEGLNILAGAGFVMLLFQPTWLFNLGFQLSFLAVSSIMLFSSPLLAGMKMNYTWWRKALGGLAVVSLVAQAGTAGVSLYNFHSFPIWFLPANLLAVPLATLCIYTGLVALLLELLGLHFAFLCGAFEVLLQAMNEVSSFFAALPAGYQEYIRFSVIDVIFYYLLWMILARIAREKIKKLFVYSLLSLFLGWSTAGLIIKLIQQGVNEKCVLNHEKPLILEKLGRKAFLLSGIEIEGLEELKPLREWAMARGVPFSEIYNETLPDGLIGNDTIIGERSVSSTFSEGSAIIQTNDPENILLTGDTVPDIIWVCGLKGLRKLASWPLKKYPTLILCDRSIGYLTAEQQRIMDSNNIQCYMLRKKGAWSEDWKWKK